MPLDFPATPSVGQAYNGYVWSGTAWEAANPNTISLTGQVIVADAAARDALYPSPVQGNAVFRTDLGVEETYYGLYNVTTNPGGRSAAGWYQEPKGRIVQVVQTVKTDTFSASQTIGNFTSAAMSASITPLSTANKILVIVNFSMNSNGAGATYAALYRNNSISSYRGDAASNRLRVTTSSGGGSINLVPFWSSSIVYLDSPNTTSSVTYDLRLGSSGNQTVYLNRGANDGDTAEFGRGASSITLMEVVA